RWGHAHFVERVPVKHAELRTRFENESVAVLAQRKDSPVRGPGRCRECGWLRANPLLFVDLPAGARVMAREETRIKQHVEKVAIQDRRRVVRGRGGLMPRDKRVVRLAW